jgi:tRNA threonylcarbamoyladenosine biosynthesis protein TsaB
MIYGRIPHMKLLGIEMSSAHGSVAIKVNGHVEQRSLGPSRQQAAHILPIIDELLSDYGLKVAELDLLTFSAGPGSFTGIRMALGVVQGLALATELPVLPMSSLQILAQTACRLHPVQNIFCVIDAFMGEVYSGLYQRSARNVDTEIMLPLRPDQLTKPQETPFPADGTWLGVGNAWEVYKNELLPAERIASTVIDLQPQAQDLLTLAENMLDIKQSIDEILPYYLRDKSAWQINI